MRSALCGVLLCGIGVRAAAQEREVTFEEAPQVTVTGFAVGSAGYDRVQTANSFTAGKLALSLFKPAGDFYLFGQLTTALEDGASATEIDNLIVSWTPHTRSQWTVAFGKFDAPVGFERDDEPLNLIPTNSFNFSLARPAKFTGAIVRLTTAPASSTRGDAVSRTIAPVNFAGLASEKLKELVGIRLSGSPRPHGWSWPGQWRTAGTSTWTTIAARPGCCASSGSRSTGSPSARAACTGRSRTAPTRISAACSPPTSPSISGA